MAHREALVREGLQVLLARDALEGHAPPLPQRLRGTPGEGGLHRGHEDEPLEEGGRHP